MSKTYCYNKDGYYTHSLNFEYSSDIAFATDIEPELKVGFIPKWEDGKWVNIENHVGKTGFIRGKEFTITEYGAVPEGFSLIRDDTLSLEELKKELLDRVKKIRAGKEEGYAPVMINGKKQLIGTGLSSEVRLNSVMNLFSENKDLVIEDWKLQNNEYIELNYETFNLIKKAMMEAKIALYSVERQKQQEIEVIKTLEVLKEYRDNYLMLGWD